MSFDPSLFQILTEAITYDPGDIQVGAIQVYYEPISRHVGK
jgi:hypothetical protein